MNRKFFAGITTALSFFYFAGLSPAKAEGEKPAPGDPPLLAKTNLAVDLGGGVSMEFILIQPGSFTMGSAASPLLDQKPPHRVTITKPFYLGKYEVTQEQWEAVMHETPAIHKGPNYPGHQKFPVENVSWEYSQVFLKKLKEVVPGYEFRLPTEAEWEYACRAGTTNRFSFGDREQELDQFAWFSANSNGQTHPVGTRKPNAWGLFDMHGNVWEWCNDVYAPYPSGKLPEGIGAGTTRVLRGGAYNSGPDRLSSTYRHDLEPDDGFRYYGLRCVAVPSSKQQERHE